MDFDLETMDSVRVGPFGQVFCPDHIVFGHTGAGIIWRRDAASFIWTRLSYQELTNLLLHDSIKLRPSRVLVSTNCGLGREPSLANLELELHVHVKVGSCCL